MNPHLVETYIVLPSRGHPSNLNVLLYRIHNCFVVSQSIDKEMGVLLVVE
jgi:hypothetical protein